MSKIGEIGNMVQAGTGTWKPTRMASHPLGAPKETKKNALTPHFKTRI